MRKVIFLMLFVIILNVSLIEGCSYRENDSLDMINKYYNNIKNKNFDTNYDYLASASRNIWTKEEFQAWEDMHNQIMSCKDVKITKINEFNNKELDGTEYDNVVEYSITETDHNNTNNKDVDSNYTRYVVKDNGEWKIYRGKEDPKEEIASVASILAGMYVAGTGKTQDFTIAISTLEYAIKVDPEYSPSYYLLGLTNYQLGKYDDAIKNEQECIDKSKNEKEKSKGYYGLAEIYKWEKDYSSAKDYCEKALEANQDNQDAKDMLANIS